MNEYKTKCKVHYQHSSIPNMINQRLVDVYYNEILMYKVDLQKMHNNSYKFEIFIGQRYGNASFSFSRCRVIKVGFGMPVPHVWSNRFTIDESEFQITFSEMNKYDVFEMICFIAH